MKLSKQLGLMFIAVLAITLTIILNKPVDARVNNYQTLIDQGWIDGIKTPAELGIDYLSPSTMELADNSLIEAIYEAEKEVSLMPEDVPLMFDLGTNHPISVGRLNDDYQLTRTEYEAIGYVNRQTGHGESFRNIEFRTMFVTEARNGGDLAITPEAKHILVADAQGFLSQRMRVIFIDLIVHDKVTGEIFVIPDANPNAVCRDALNSVLNGTVKVNGHELLW